ncbi:MAG: ATP-dependent 6-phosphofructokinase [Candidatus Edwardsbacteria bacterium]
MLVDKKLKRLGILTGGGDCPGLNAVIRAVVKTSILQYSLEVVGVEDGYAGLIENRFRPLNLNDVGGIISQGGTILGTSNRDNPFHYAETEGEKTIFKDVSEKVLKNLQNHGLEAIITVGGDGTLTVAKQLSEKGVSVIGVPKTIDNDISATDVSFGFDSALTTATEAIDKLNSTAISHHRVIVMETMGRYAGWIALEAGMAGGAEVILIPEIPYKIEIICDKIKERSYRGKRFSIVVIAEGAKPAGGEMTVQRIVAESTDQIRLGGVGHKLAQEIETRTQLETRVTVLGHLQRGGSPTPFDRILGTRFGVSAVHLAVQGNFGQMVALRGIKIIPVPLSEAVSTLRRVSPECELIKASKSVGICFGDE